MENHCGISIITAELRESLRNRSKIIAEWRKSMRAGGEGLRAVGEGMGLGRERMAVVGEGMMKFGKERVLGGNEERDSRRECGPTGRKCVGAAIERRDLKMHGGYEGTILCGRSRP
jgi:hypothetical protein